MRKLGQWLRPLTIWSYRRGSWQYDLTCALILGYIFLTPREFFHDQPRPQNVQQIQSVGDADGTLVFWVEPAIVDDTAEANRGVVLRELLRQRSGKALLVTDIQPLTDEQDSVRGYLVYARP
jgi:hypothetical protein